MHGGALMRLKVEVTAEDINNGEPGSCERCPIALALLRMGIEEPYVDQDAIKGRLKGRRFASPMKGHAWEFIDAFDEVFQQGDRGLDVDHVALDDPHLGEDDIECATTPFTFELELEFPEVG